MPLFQRNSVRTEDVQYLQCDEGALSRVEAERYMDVFVL